MVLASVPAAAQAPQQDSALIAALTANRHTVSVDAQGRLAGAGGRLLVAEGERSRFFLIGEEHGVAQVPRLAGALFTELAPSGYRHLAIETGETVAAGLDQASRGGVDGVRAFVNQYWPGAPFYNLREEAALLAAATSAAGLGGDAGDGAHVIWGLDYDILADRYALRRLRDAAPTPEARTAADRVIAESDRMLAAGLAAGNPGALYMFASADTALAGLRAAYGSAATDEAAGILAQMEQTISINQNFLRGRGYESNTARAAWMKANFMRRYTAAAGGGAAPRVMLKFGANHMIRGRNWTGTYDLGTLLPDLAEASGGRAFSLLAVGGAGSRHAALDPRTLSYTPAPGDFAADDEAMAPMYRLADPNAWTLYDLRPLRAPVSSGRLKVNPALERLIFGFDAVVVLTGSTPSTPLIEPYRAP